MKKWNNYVFSSLKQLVTVGVNQFHFFIYVFLINLFFFFFTVISKNSKYKSAYHEKRRSYWHETNNILYWS